jgi:asparagine synthase (glutamine-hydrolysing)
MCGIWTCISTDNQPVSLVSIRHRGPDDFGRRSFKTAAGTLEMANWRLSILGRSSSGHQPMSYAEGRYWIVFNGEIYNYLELREQLQQHGYQFRTDTDTEVILAAYAHFGESCLERFNGMFAFCLWDDLLRRLLVARDRFGEKPLYYLNSPGGLAFASEIKQFATLPFFSAQLNVQEAYEFLTYGFIDHNHDTLFRDVKQLRGGECASISMDSWHTGGELVKRQWYSLSVPGEFRGTLEQAAHRYGELLADSTRLRLRADVSVGSCLSGGLDSSSIVSTVSRIRDGSRFGKVQETFSSCFDDPGCDERIYMHEVEEQCRAKAHYVFPRQDDLFGALDRLVWHHDAPLGTTSVFAQWELFREARRSGVVVMLDGQGGDEQLAS